MESVNLRVHIISPLIRTLIHNKQEISAQLHLSQKIDIKFYNKIRLN
jgi:hypothetical protein